VTARKELTIKNGNEWLGEDSIDDYTYCKEEDMLLRKLTIFITPTLIL
jgi:hypothetical protein